MKKARIRLNAGFFASGIVRAGAARCQFTGNEGRRAGTLKSPAGLARRRTFADLISC